MRIYGVCLLLLSLLPLPAWAQQPAPQPAPQPVKVKRERPVRILMLINAGFMPPEYQLPRQLYQAAGFQVTVAAKHLAPISPDARYADAPAVRPDLRFDQIVLGDYDALTFVGGNGAWTDFFPNDTVHALLRDALQRNMVTGLLCASTGLLGLAGNYSGQGVPVAKGRRVTGYYRVESLLRELGELRYEAGDPQQPHVVVDGNLITGRDPLSSQLFGETVVQRLQALYP